MSLYKKFIGGNKILSNIISHLRNCIFFPSFLLVIQKNFVSYSYMAFYGILLCPKEKFSMAPLLAIIAITAFAAELSIQAQPVNPFNCSQQIKNCTASLYHINAGHSRKQVAAFYSVNITQITPISHFNSQDYLVTVPCSCMNINGTTAYFHSTKYKVQTGDTFYYVSTRIYNGQVWVVEHENALIAGGVIPIHLLCGCPQNDAQIVVTYTVQNLDTLPGIASLLSSTVNGIESMNTCLEPNPGFIIVGWVLFVPMKKIGNPAPAPSPVEEDY